MTDGAKLSLATRFTLNFEPGLDLLTLLDNELESNDSLTKWLILHINDLQNFTLLFYKQMHRVMTKAMLLVTFSSTTHQMVPPLLHSQFHP